MAKTTEKGVVGEAMVIADLTRQGHDVAIPFGHNQPFDLIVVRKEDGRLEKVQVKCTTSDGRVIHARISSSSAWVQHEYTKDEVDWIAVYDATTHQCFYLPSALWHGMSRLNIRLQPTANGQRKHIRFAKDYECLVGSPQNPCPGTERDGPLQLALPPE